MSDEQHASTVATDRPASAAMSELTADRPQPGLMRRTTDPDVRSRRSLRFLCGGADALAGAIALLLSPLSFSHVVTMTVVVVTLVAMDTVAPPLVLRSSRTLRQLPVLLVGPAMLMALGVAPALVARHASLTIVLILAARVPLYAAIRAARRRGRFREQVVIAGSGVVASRLVETLRDSPELGLDPVLCLPTAVSTAGGDDGDRLRLPERITAGRLILAFARAPDITLLDALRRLRSQRVEVHVVGRLFDLIPVTLRHGEEELGGFPLHRLRALPPHSPGWRLKRVLDVVLSLMLLVVLSPLLGLLAAAVALTSQGPVLFRQIRVGQHGREFEILKFRSLRENADSDVTWSVHHDGRVTPVGRLLRRSNLDELPQLWNILRGDMSLVGPRPERPFFVTHFERSIPDYGSRHRVPVGVTGLAQVHGLRGDTSIAERVRLDNCYIERWSLWEDLVILGRTVGQMARRGSE